MSTLSNFILKGRTSDIISSMRLGSFCQILTLVLLGASASGAPNLPPPAKALRPEIMQPTLPAGETSPQLENMDSVPPSNLPAPPEGAEDRLMTNRLLPTRVVRSHSRTLSAGVLQGALENTDLQSQGTLQLSFQDDRQDESARNWGLQLTTGGLWGLHADYRSFCCLGRRYEPYWTLGVGSLYKPSEQLASLVNFERYRLRIGGGFDDFGGFRRRLRLEALLHLSPLGLSGELSLGWTWDSGEIGF